MRTRRVYLFRTMTAAVCAAILLAALSATGAAALPSRTANWTDDFGSPTLDASHGLLPGEVGLSASNSTFGAAEIAADFDFFSLTPLPHRVLLPLIVKQEAPALAYRLVPDSGTCVPNAGVAYYNGVVRDRAGELQNGVCVHVAFFGPRNTKCSGCDGVGNGNWGFAPFGGPAPANIPVEIFIVPCPAYLPPGGQSSDFGDLTPLSDKWLFTTSSTNMQCTGITFMQN